MSYVNELLKKDCYSQLHPLFVRCNNPAKEISESMAAYKHLCQFIKFDESVTNFHIGDGMYCRTGALFSFLTKSRNMSIDPIINCGFMLDWRGTEKVKSNFAYLSHRYEEYSIIEEKGYSCNLVCVHSHVDLKELIKHFPKWQYLYTNPCCKPNEQILDLDFQKQNNISVVLAGIDLRILSPKNMVYIYKNNKEVK